MEFLILKFIKYSIVGVSGVFCDFGATWLLKEKAHVNKYIANTFGFILAATSNYILNRVWTFASKNDKIIQEYIYFFTIALAGLALNNLILMILNDKLKLNFYLSKSIAIVIVTLWNFIMNYLFTFK